MKNIIKTTLAGMAMLVAAVAANAQTPYNTTGNSAGNAGSTGITVTVAKSADLRASANGINTIGGGATLSGFTADNALNVQVSFGDASPNNTNVANTGNQAQLMYAHIPVKVRSNTNYDVYAMLETGGTIPDGAGNSGDFKTGDVGFGLINSLPSSNGGLMMPGNSLSFNNYVLNLNNVATVEGQPQFPVNRTLNSIGYATPKKVAFGNRISLRGDNTSTDNFRFASLVFAVKPQYYTPTPSPLTATMKLYVVTP